jgi:alanyl-tRNA synthetase
LTGPAAIDWFRSRSDALDEAAGLLGNPRDAVAGARRAAERLDELERSASESGSREAAGRAEELVARSAAVGGIEVVVERADIGDQRALLDLADRVKSKLGAAAVVLGGTHDGRVGIVASFADAAVERGLSAADVVREAAVAVGGGGGGRANVAQAGGRDADRLDESLEIARRVIESQLADPDG